MELALGDAFTIVRIHMLHELGIDLLVDQTAHALDMHSVAAAARGCLGGKGIERCVRQELVEVQCRCHGR
jgi:hypothetical protein